MAWSVRQGANVLRKQDWAGRRATVQIYLDDFDFGGGTEMLTCLQLPELADAMRFRSNFEGMDEFGPADAFA